MLERRFFLRLLHFKVGVAAWLVLGAIVLTAVTWGLAEHPSIPPADLVRQTVHNEIRANHDDAKYMFRDRKETPNGSQTKVMVETRDAMAGIVVAENDKPLSPERRQAELAR